MLDVCNSSAEPWMGEDVEGREERKTKTELGDTGIAMCLVGQHEDHKQGLQIQVGREEIVVNEWGAQREGVSMGGRGSLCS